MQHWKHRCALYDDRLNKKNAEENQDDEYQKYVADKPEGFNDKAAPRFAPEIVCVYQAVFEYCGWSQVRLAFMPEIKHNLCLDARARPAAGLLAVQSHID
jgi:hypothetical protein